MFEIPEIVDHAPPADEYIIVSGLAPRFRMGFPPTFMTSSLFAH